MREYGQIQCSFWIDPDIQNLSDGAARLAAYLLTGPHSNGIGCYRLPDGYVMADFGWSKEKVSKAFEELFQIGFCERCESTDFVLIPRFLRWNQITNGNVASAREKEFDTIPRRSSIYQRLCDALLTYGKHLSKDFRNRLETLSKGYGKQDPTLPNPEPDPEPTQEEESAEQGSPPPDDPVVALIPLNTGEEFPVTETKARELAELYPSVDVPQALRNMRGWCIANPKRRKTKSGVMDFITSWLARDQNRGPARVPARSQGGQRRGGFGEIDYEAEAREMGFLEVI